MALEDVTDRVVEVLPLHSVVPALELIAESAGFTVTVLLTVVEQPLAVAVTV